jgi:hypothetical protein
MAKPSQEYLKYIGLVSQMFVLLLVGWFLGGYIDGLIGSPQPYVAISLMILFLFAIFYKLIKDLY